MQAFIAHPFSALAGAAAAGVALLLACPSQDAHPIANVACSIVPSRAIAAVAGRPVRLAPTDGSVCRYLGTESDLEITATVAPEAPVLPFGANAARVDLADGRVFVVRVRDEEPGAEPERLAVRIADLAAERTANDGRLGAAR